VQHAIEWARDIERPGDVVLDELEAGVSIEVRQVCRRTRKKIIHADNGVSFHQQPIRKM
jgi:hypothetical protein